MQSFPSVFIERNVCDYNIAPLPGACPPRFRKEHLSHAHSPTRYPTRCPCMTVHIDLDFCGIFASIILICFIAKISSSICCCLHYNSKSRSISDFSFLFPDFQRSSYLYIKCFLAGGLCHSFYNEESRQVNAEQFRCLLALCCFHRPVVAPSAFAQGSGVVPVAMPWRFVQCTVSRNPSSFLLKAQIVVLVSGEGAGPRSPTAAHLQIMNAQTAI